MSKPGGGRFEDLAGFSYPTWVTCVFDYCATGEGRTVGVSMSYAHSATVLAKHLTDRFDQFFLDGAEVWPRLHVPEELWRLVPSAVADFAADPDTIAGNFSYESVFHLNRS